MTLCKRALLSEVLSKELAFMFLYAPLAQLAKAALFCVNTQLYTVRRRASPLTREKRFWKCERCEVSATCLTHGHMLLYKTGGSNWGSVGDPGGIHV